MPGAHMHQSMRQRREAVLRRRQAPEERHERKHDDEDPGPEVAEVEVEEEAAAYEVGSAEWLAEQQRLTAALDPSRFDA